MLAIIPARGGSKRLPRKNVLELAGKPLIAWTIEAALNSKYIDRVIVSTDDDEIASISKQYGADVPFMRPLELATDETASIDVVLHVLDQLKGYNDIILLQPTSPLRSSQDIDESIEIFKVSNSNAVISVCKAEHSPLWCNVISKDNSLISFLDHTILNKRSRDLEEYYCLNGAIYICNIEELKREKTFFLSSKCRAYKMSRENSIDIDAKIDFLFAELIMKTI